jgi:hypothetical protein
MICKVMKTIMLIVSDFFGRILFRTAHGIIVQTRLEVHNCEVRSPELGLDKATSTAKIPEILSETVFLPCILAEPEL